MRIFRYKQSEFFHYYFRILPFIERFEATKGQFSSGSGWKGVVGEAFSILRERFRDSEFRTCGEKMLIVVGTYNQQKIFEKIDPYLKTVYAVWGHQGRSDQRNYPDLPRPSFRETVSGFLYLVWSSFRNKLPPRERVSLDVLYQDILLFYSFRKFLRGSKLEKIVFFNDHYPWYRMLIYAAKDSGVKTIYIPHASVSERFPRLIFDYAFLEGAEMLDTYKEVGEPEGVVRIIGNPRYDGLEKKKECDPRDFNVGIAFNLLDDPERIRNLILTLEELSPMLLSRYGRKMKILIRPHPSIWDHSHVAHLRAECPGDWSDPRSESSADFILKLDLLFVSNSNIALESVRLKTNVVQVILNDEEDQDNYGFIRKGLVEIIRDRKDEIYPKLEEAINMSGAAGCPPQSLVSRYDGSIGSAWEGRVGQKLAEGIEEI